MPSPQFVSLAASPYDPGGHAICYHEAFGKASQKLGMTHLAYVGKDWKSGANSWIPFFKKNGSLSKRFLEFSKIFRVQKQNSIFFIESFNSIDFCALVFASFICLKQRDQLWILFRYGLPQYNLNGKIHLFLLKCLKLKIKKRLKTLTDSEAIAENFAPHLKMDMMPIPHIDFTPGSRKESKKLMCWWPGHPRVAKGLHEIQKLMETQASVENLNVMVSEEIQQKISHPCLIYCKKAMPREDYLKALFKSDVILLPYDPLVYRYGTSGIFVEAIIAGKIPLVKEGSWLANELKRYSLDELIVDWQNPQFFAHLRQLVNAPETLSKLTQMQKAYARFHSIDGFAERLKYLHTDCF